MDFIQKMTNNTFPASSGFSCSWANILSGAGAVLSGVAAFITWYTRKRVLKFENYLKTVTSERPKWIFALRECAGTLIDHLETMHQCYHARGRDERERHVRCACYKVILYLPPEAGGVTPEQGNHDCDRHNEKERKLYENLLVILEDPSAFFRCAKYDQHMKSLVSSVQDVLKGGWEDTKQRK